MEFVRSLVRRVLRRKLLTRIPDSGNRIFITFDDGPSGDHTLPLLDVLARHGAVATFFMVGREVSRWPEIARAVHARGHALGNHSLTHPRMDRMSDAARVFEIGQMQEMLGAIDARDEHLFRPPYGHLSPGLLGFCLRRCLVIAYWSRDSFDFRLQADEVIQGFRRNPPVPGDILLFHDDGAAAAAALDTLLPEWKAAGLAFSTLQR